MANFRKILDQIDDSISTFIEQVPASQKGMLRALDEELIRLELLNGRIKPTIKNLNIITNIKNKMLKVIITDNYKYQVKEFLNGFNKITKLQNEYWREIESEFKPRSILKEIKKIAIEDTANKLMETGLDAMVAEPIKDILTTNITQGGSYADLADQLKSAVNGSGGSPGLLDRHTKQVTVDTMNQYNRNYTQIVSSDLGFEWYAYQNTLITTSRAFCISMHETRYFHISQIPDLLKAKDMYYTKKNKDGTTERVKVRLNPKTDLPEGMYPNTNVSNFLTLLGGYNCGHQAGPVSENLVKMQNPKLYNEIINSAVYKRWANANKNKKGV